MKLASPSPGVLMSSSSALEAWAVIKGNGSCPLRTEGRIKPEYLNVHPALTKIIKRPLTERFPVQIILATQLAANQGQRQEH